MKTFLRFPAFLLAYNLFTILIFNLSYLKISVSGEIFTLGYLTGSQRTPGNLDYQRPGEYILTSKYNNN